MYCIGNNDKEKCFQYKYKFSPNILNAKLVESENGKPADTQC